MPDLPTHILISVALVGLYAVDCIVFLDGNFLVCRCGAEGRTFALVSPGRVTVIGGRIIYALPFFAPWMPLRRANILSPLSPLENNNSGPGLTPVMLSLALTFTHAIAIATIFIFGNSTLALTIALAVIYLSSLAFSLYAVFMIQSVRMSHALSAMVCPPNALNLLRRAELDRRAISFNTSFSSFFSSKERLHAREQLIPLLNALPHEGRDELQAALNTTEHISS